MNAFRFDIVEGQLRTNDDWCIHFGLNPRTRSHAEPYLVVIEGGEVKLARFTPNRDPDAPGLIVVGGGPGTIRRAHQAAGWLSPFPVILKTKETVPGATTPLWAYAGRWKVIGSDLETPSGQANARESAPWRATDDNPPVGVLYLEKFG